MKAKKPLKKIIVPVILSMFLAAILLAAGMGIGYHLHQPQAPATPAGYAANPAYEYLVGAAAWQTSAEAHALMLQGFHLAQSNIDDLVALANSNQQGYHWVEEAGQKKLFQADKQVAVVCDIDDTLVDGVHYTANVIGRDGEWNNKAFTDFIQSNGCTALPGAVEFANYCVENGIALFYVTALSGRGSRPSGRTSG